MADLHLSRALLPDGWSDAVRVTSDASGEIVSVRPGADPAGAERVEGVAVPGVPNLHSHAFQRAMAGLAERGSPSGDTFWSWRDRMYAFLAVLGPDDVEAVAGQLFVEALRHGFTAVAEFHYLRNAPDGGSYDDPVEMARRIHAAARRAGMGLTLLPTVYRSADFGGVPATADQGRFTAPVPAILEDLSLLREAAAGDPDTAVGLALHSLRAVPPDEMGEALEGLQAVAPGAPVHIHLAEQRREVEACRAWSGASPARWLLDHAPVDGRWCLIHATHMEPDEVEAVARSGAVVGLCPTTEANLGDGLVPFTAYRDAGGAWGVGTDSHVSVSPVAELRTLEYGQRLAREERNVAAGSRDASTGRALLEAAWAGGARACGRSLGRIAPGCRADLVVLDPEHPALVGREDDDLLDAWVFSGEDTPVRHVMVGGQWVILDGRHPRQQEILEAYRPVARRLARR